MDTAIVETARHGSHRAVEKIVINVEVTIKQFVKGRCEMFESFPNFAVKLSFTATIQFLK